MSCSTEGDLRRFLFSPRSVAIVGQSDDATKTAGRPLKFLRRVGYAGRVYPINPRRETVLGERAWPARTGIRIVGPSSLGVVDLRTRVMLTANAAFDEKDFPLGRVFAASHSGSMIGALMSRGKARGTGFAG